MRNLDISTFLGIILTFIIFGVAITLEGNLREFFDIASVMIVVGGTFMVTLACFSVEEIFKAHKSILKQILFAPEDGARTGKSLLKISLKAYRNGLLSLENDNSIDISSNIFHRGLQMVIDGESPEAIQSILEQKIDAANMRNEILVSILKKSAEIAPAIGLVGTLIGLVQMLGRMDNVAAIGPAMALALLTTLYGAVLAYVIFFPLASKFERNHMKEKMNFVLYKKTLLSMAKNEHPSNLEISMNSILPPEKRLSYF